MLGNKFKILTITLLTLLSTATFAAVHTQYSSTVCGNTPYLFGCDKLTTSGAHSNTLGDSTTTVNLTFGSLKATAYTATIEPGQTYLFGCQKLTADASETNTLQQAGCECDSTVTLTLQVQAPAPVPTSVTVAYTANIYDGETYLFGCQKLTAAGPYTETFQRVGGGDSIVNLTLNVNAAPVQKVTVEYNSEIEVGQTYLFGCKTYSYTETGMQTLKDSLPAVNGGDSIIIVHLTVSAGGAAKKDTVVGYTTSIYTGQTYLFGCQKLTTAGVYKDTLPRDLVLGDSVTVLTLNVVDPSVTVAYTANIYDGETYLFGCQKLTVAGPYTETFQRAAGGDSIVNLTLNVNPIPDITVAYDATIKQGETYLFGCQKLTAAGAYTETFQRVAGGDSIVNLTLAVLTETYGDTTATTCDSLVWYEHNCKTSGDYVHTFIGGNVYGGDSILTLHLTVYSSAAPTTAPAVTACDLYYWAEADTTILTSGSYTHVFSTIHGCDSVVTLPVTIHNSDVVFAPAVTACDSYYWAGPDTTITTSGTYVHTFTNIHGCDSIVSLDVTINTSYNVNAPAVADCDSYYWAAADTTILTSGTYVHTFASIHGCDSVVTLPVTIYKSATPTTAPAVTACDQYYWAEADTTILTSGSYTHVFSTIHGCDSVVTLPVTIHNSDVVVITTPIEACDSYYWAEADTTILTSGTYVHVFANVHGCDSVVSLPVTIHKSEAKTATPVETCDSYYWAEADTTILSSGTYVHVFQTIHGCDSVVTLGVTINKSTSSVETPVETCDSYYWASADTTILTSGTYTHVFSTIHGCDSVVTLTATIHNSASTVKPAVTECNKYYWAEVDTTIITSGTYTHVFQTIHGCDSTVTFTVTINVPYQTSLSLVHKFGDRLIMIDRTEINAIPGWYLDSLDIEHPEYVTWYEIDPAGNERVCGTGYYYNLASGEPLPSGYTYYAVVNIPGTGVSCGAQGTTVQYTIPAHAAAPALVPTLARPGENIRVINLDPETETTVRVYTAEGMLISTQTVQGEPTYTITAARDNGFYLVELSNDSMKSTLRYIVK